jgi:hypothetical protein
MRHAEIETWSKWALPARVAQVERCARIAGDGWRRRLRDPWETLDAMTFRRGGMITTEAAVHAAATVTIELQVILHIWPGRLDQVLRPSLRWTG